MYYIYMTLVLDQLKFPLINPKSFELGIYQWQVPLTLDSGCIFVVYTVMAVVHMILYYDEVILACYNTKTTCSIIVLTLHLACLQSLSAMRILRKLKHL